MVCLDPSADGRPDEIRWIDGRARFSQPLACVGDETPERSRGDWFGFKPRLRLNFSSNGKNWWLSHRTGKLWIFKQGVTGLKDLVSREIAGKVCCQSPTCMSGCFDVFSHQRFLQAWAIIGIRYPCQCDNDTYQSLGGYIFRNLQQHLIVQRT